MIEQTNCEFLNPVNLGTPEMPDFEYQNQVCSTTKNYFQEYEVQMNGTTTPFIFSSVWSGPEIVLLVFALLFGIFYLTGSILNFVGKKKIMIQRKL